MSDLFQVVLSPPAIYLLLRGRILRIVLRVRVGRRVGLGYYLPRYRIERPGCSNKELLV